MLEWVQWILVGSGLAIGWSLLDSLVARLLVVNRLMQVGGLAHRD